MTQFELAADIPADGDVPQAIDALVRRLEQGKRDQVLKSNHRWGETFVMANVITRIQRPTLVLSHTPTRALQLYAILRALFPKNSVVYFPSQDDYSRPASYEPHRDVYTEREAPCDEQILQWRYQVIGELISRRDVIVVATTNGLRHLESVNGVEGYIPSARREIEAELNSQLDDFRRRGKTLEALRLEGRIRFELEMLSETGSCPGQDDFRRPLFGRKPGEVPRTILDFFTEDSLLWIDESSVTTQQIRMAAVEDTARKSILVQHGFRLPMVLDDRPLTFEEWDSRRHQTILVTSALTDWELDRSGGEVVTLSVCGDAPTHLATELARTDVAEQLGLTGAIGAEASSAGELHAEKLEQAAEGFDRAAQIRDQISKLSSPTDRPRRRKPKHEPLSAAAPAPKPLPDPQTAAAIEYSENVQFTVFRPKEIPPLKWQTLLAFAHLAELPPEADKDEPDPVQQVQEQAQQALGSAIAAYGKVTQDATSSVPRMGSIVFVPKIAGIEFNPPRHEFQWIENVHKVEFRLRALRELEGQTARGRLTVYLGSLILAEVGLQFRVTSQAGATETSTGERVSSRPFHNIFASYSHADAAIVDQFEQYAKGIGDRYLRDSVHLRAGQQWNDELRRMIDQADIFQLFWSRNSMHSEFVRQEWEYALSLGRPEFVRPTYWETPLPEVPEKGMPPEHLRRLHFQFVGSQPAPPGVQMAETNQPPTPPVAAARPAPPNFTPASSSPRSRRRFWMPATAATALVLLVGLMLYSPRSTPRLGDPTSSLPPVAPTTSPNFPIELPRPPEQPLPHAPSLQKPDAVPKDHGKAPGSAQPKATIPTPAPPRSTTPPAVAPAKSS